MTSETYKKGSLSLAGTVALVSLPSPARLRNFPVPASRLRF